MTQFMDAVVVDGQEIPANVAKGLPTEFPSGCQLVIFQRVGHGDGWPYGWRSFAIPFGTFQFEDWSGGNTWETQVEVTQDHPTVVSTMDHNGEQTIPLPKGSWEYVDGRWTESMSVEYDY